MRYYVNIAIVTIHSHILEEDKDDFVIFCNDGKVFRGALFFPLDADEMIVATKEIKHLETDNVWDIMHTAYQMLKSHDMLARDDKTLHCMLHWQHVNGFSDEMFTDIYGTKNDTEYLAMVEDKQRHHEVHHGEPTQRSMESAFEIADVGGDMAVIDTYNDELNKRKDSIHLMTELVMHLNRKCWDMYENSFSHMSEIYSDLFYKAKDYVFEHFEDDDIDYFLRMID